MTAPSQKGTREPPGSEEDHRGVDAEQRDEGGNVGDAGEHRDEHDHHRRRQRVLDPAEVVSTRLQAGPVPLEPRAGDDPVEERREEQEDRNAPAESQVEQGFGGRQPASGRSLEERLGDREGEVAGEGNDGDRLGRVKQAHHDVVAAEPVHVGSAHRRHPRPGRVATGGSNPTSTYPLKRRASRRGRARDRRRPCHRSGRRHGREGDHRATAGTSVPALRRRRRRFRRRIGSRTRRRSR